MKITNTKESNHIVEIDRKIKPFIKWVGGKSQLLQKFSHHYPKELESGKISKYFEPFVGGGAVFFDITRKYNLKYAKLLDINEDLILTYQVVKDDFNKLIDKLDFYSDEYLRLNSEERKKYYYKKRKAYNNQKKTIDYSEYSENWISRAAQLIFLNKTCFNGLYRVNSKGEFNCPSGEYKNHNPSILDKTNLESVAFSLQIAEIQHGDFTQILNEVDQNSFVYLDPPYRPLSKTANFTSYTASAFNDDMQLKLSEFYNELHNKGAKVMLSNSDPKNLNPTDNFFDELYSDYNIVRVPAKRMINSNGEKRGEINEIIITNY